MATKRIGLKCKTCKQNIADVIFHEESKSDFQCEKDALKCDNFRINLGELYNKEVPSVKLTLFSVYDKYKHLSPFDTGLIENSIDLYLSGYIKTIDNEDSSANDGVFIQNAGPIVEWWTYGFDGGEKCLTGLSTENAMYYLMDPSKDYEDIYQNLQHKIRLSKVLIEFLLDFGHQNPPFEDLIQHLKNFNIPEVEELLFREAHFLCTQIISYDEEEATDELPMISYSCIQTLINLTGITVTKRKTKFKLTKILKPNILCPKAISTKLVKEVFEKSFYKELNNNNNSEKKDSTTSSSNSESFEKSLVSCSSDISKSFNSDLGEKQVKHKECSKVVIHNVKWLKKNSVNHSGYVEYSSASVGNFIINQGDYVMLHPEEPNEPLRIAKVCYMYDSDINSAMFHAHFFCRGIDTILGNTANLQELFVVDDCDDYPLGCIIKKTEVKFVNSLENWSSLGNIVNLPLEREDNGENYYYFSKIYDYDCSKFKDYKEELEVDYEYACLSCLWKHKIESNETPIYKNNCVTWKNKIFRIGTAVFLEPGQSKYVPESVLEEEKNDTNGKVYPELYRKKLDISRGSNLDTPQPLAIGLIEDIKKQKNDIRIKVRLFYRPEDTQQSHFLAYVTDINYLFWSDEVKWTTFKNVVDKCYVRYFKNDRLAKKWSTEGPFRFYYSKAYDYKKFNIYNVPPNEKSMDCSSIKEKSGYITRSILKSKNLNVLKLNVESEIESPPPWQEIDKPLKCMDIYAGCGGLSAGLHESGVAKTLWAIEKETAPAQSYQINNPHCQVFIDDCNNILEALIEGKAKELGYPDRGDVELLVGGPPCQGFSGMNRFSTGQDSFMKNAQIITFLSFCDYYRPKYFIFENVRNFVSFKKSIVLKLTLKCLLAMGYQVSFGILQAGNFGLPQTRRRFILIGAAPGYVLPNLPDPLHAFSRSGTFLSILVDGLRYDTGSPWTESLPYRTICVRDAIADLPDIDNGAMVAEIPYDEEAKSHFQKCMRKNNKTESVKDHICKEMSLIVETRISHIPTYPGADWRDLPNIEVQLKNGSVAKVLKYPYRKKNQKKEDPPKGVCKCVLGKQCDPSDRQSNTLIPWFLVHTADRHNNWVGVYGRLEWDGFFGTTITNPEPTGTQGRVLHPDQNRLVSVRECARSQGFPDDYKFCGTILEKHRQIGNAVPPPLALALGKEIIKAHNALS